MTVSRGQSCAGATYRLLAAEYDVHALRYCVLRPTGASDVSGEQRLHPSHRFRLHDARDHGDALRDTATHSDLVFHPDGVGREEKRGTG